MPTAGKDPCPVCGKIVTHFIEGNDEKECFLEMHHADGTSCDWYYEREKP
jgi:hypothetical protein